MSRRGKMPIPLPKGVEVTVKGDSIEVKGSKGTLNQKLMPQVIVDINEGEVVVSTKGSLDEDKKFHGLYRALIANMVVGVSQGFEKKLEMIGVGYRAAMQGQQLDLQLGFSHPTKLDVPEGISVEVVKNTSLTVSGCDKRVVGQFAADIRSLRPPEVYKGKGVRYVGEYVRRKSGKAGKTK